MMLSANPVSRRATLLSRLLAILAALLLASSIRAPAGGHAQTPLPVGAEVFVDSELERYLRVLQSVGLSAPYPWTVRGFSPAEVDSMAPEGTAHPWANRFNFAHSTGRLESAWIRPEVATMFNSAYPHGGAGGVWAGRGFTAAIRAGWFGRYGPISLTLAPMAFLAQNADFEVVPGSGNGIERYRDAESPGAIDLPQRFGPGRYGRLDPGNSTLRADALGVAIGLSTATQHWGPAERNPLILGSNAGGFPHAFIGTSMPVNLWIGHLHGRIVAGRLSQSDYSPVDAAEGTRLMNGLAMIFQPRGAGGLELGLTRFFHLHWELGASELLRSVESFWKKDLPETGTRPPENQLASIFFRWNFPRSGLEIGAEYMREDASYDVRTLILEPDDLRAYMFLLRKTWRLDQGELIVLRSEVMNAESTHRQRLGSRPSLAYSRYALYRHSALRQGHTHNGQLLATPYGHAAAASFIGLDRYSADGRLSVEGERVVWQDSTTARWDANASVDVSYALGVSASRFLGPAEVRGGIRGDYRLNRHLQEDAFNLNVTMSGAVAF